MCPTQLEKLTSSVGNYVNNCTPKVLLAGILQQTAFAETLSGMTLTAPQDHTLVRFKMLNYWTYMKKKSIGNKSSLKVVCLQQFIRSIMYRKWTQQNLIMY